MPEFADPGAAPEVMDSYRLYSSPTRGGREGSESLPVTPSPSVRRSVASRSSEPTSRRSTPGAEAVAESENAGGESDDDDDDRGGESEGAETSSVSEGAASSPPPVSEMDRWLAVVDMSDWPLWIQGAIRWALGQNDRLFRVCKLWVEVEERLGFMPEKGAKRVRM